MSNSIAIRNLTPEESEMAKAYKGERKFRRYGTGGQFLTFEYAAQADHIHNLRLRPDDVIVHSFTKSGTIITQEIVWLLQNNLDYKTASENTLFRRYYHIEYTAFFSAPDISPDELPSPRCVKTHLALDLLPPNMLDTCRVIHVSRDPREAVVSMYYDNSKMTQAYPFEGDLKSYWQLFEKDLVIYAPYFTSEKQAWAQRDHPNMLFLFYEEFIKDLPSTVKRIATFLGKNSSKEDIKNVSDYCKKFFEPYPANPGKGNISLKGEGSWRDHFDEEFQKRTQEWMQRNLSDTDLTFPST